MMRTNISRLGLLIIWLFATSASAEGVYSTAKGKRVGTFDVFRDCEVCPEMIVLPMGRFQMGSTVEQAIAARFRFFQRNNVDTARYEEKLRNAFVNLGIDPDQPEEGLLEYYRSGNVVREEDPWYSANGFLHEVPRHSVVIDRPIAMGRHEITREEWAACVEDGGCEQGQTDVPVSEYAACERSSDCVPSPDSRIKFRLQKNPPRADHPRSPMTGITYYEMIGYTDWLNQKLGADVYRLPSEAEWEYAARAGTTTIFAQGDTLSLEQANFLVVRRDLVDGEFVWNTDLGSAKDLLPVDDLDSANGWGLRHMSGNSSEFTSTCGEGPHRGLPSSSDYIEADKKRTDCRRSVKGGMYTGSVELARPARRVAISSDHWSKSIGFRVLRDLSAAP